MCVFGCLCPFSLFMPAKPKSKAVFWRILFILVFSLLSLSLSGLSLSHTHTHIYIYRERDIDIYIYINWEQFSFQPVLHGARATQSHSFHPLTIHSSINLQTHSHSTNHLLIPQAHAVIPLHWKAEGPWFDIASALPSLQKGCGLWTLSCDFVPHS